MESEHACQRTRTQGPKDMLTKSHHHSVEQNLYGDAPRLSSHQTSEDWALELVASKGFSQSYETWMDARQGHSSTLSDRFMTDLN